MTLNVWACGVAAWELATERNSVRFGDVPAATCAMGRPNIRRRGDAGRRNGAHRRLGRPHAAAAAARRREAWAGRCGPSRHGAERTNRTVASGRTVSGASAMAGSDYWLARCPQGLEAARKSLPGRRGAGVSATAACACGTGQRQRGARRAARPAAILWRARHAASASDACVTVHGRLSLVRQRAAVLWHCTFRTRTQKVL